MKFMTIILALAITGVSPFAYGEANDVVKTNKLIRIGKREYTPAQVKELVHRASLKKNGGQIREANSAKGTFVVLNAQTKVPEAALTSTCAMLDEWMRVQVSCKRFDDKLDCTNVKAAIVSSGGVLGVAVVDVDGLPTLLTAPEAGWSMVNVRALAADNPKSDVLSSRVGKEILRAFAMVTGGAFLAHTPIVMRNVKALGDLDEIPRTAYGLEVIKRVLSTSAFYGLTPWRQASYRKACVDGWAPDPTNDYQKAIWNEIHVMPTEPMKILPESKRQKK